MVAVIFKEVSERFKVVMEIITVKKTVLEGNCLLLAGATCGNKFGFPGVGSNSGYLTGNRF